MKSAPPFEAFMDRPQVAIFRYDPSRDQEPRYDHFEVPLEKGMVILDVLKFVYENVDGSLAFEHGCRYGRCGLCAVKINGKPQLACQTLAEPTMIIEPLDNFPIVRDLVVDRGEVDERVKQIQPFLQRNPTQVKVPQALEPNRFETFRAVSRCIDCLVCHSSCPSFSLNPYIFCGPSVFVELARYALDPRDVMDRVPLAHSAGLFNCFQCGKCNQVCPHHIPIQEKVLERLRSIAVSRGVAPAAVFEVAKNLQDRGRPLVTTQSRSGTFLEKMVSRCEKEPSAGKIGLFIGCLINADPRLQSIGRKTLEVLQKNNMSVEIPREQVCCGLPWIQMGEREQAKNLVEKNVLLFEEKGISHVVAICPGCGMVMKNEWPEIFASLKGRPPSFRISDLSEFWVGMGAGARKWVHPLSLQVTFHDPCHLGRGQGIHAAPREILSRLPGVGVREMPEADRCCGGGGMVRATNWMLAQSAALRKIEDLRDLKVDGIVTTCPTCLLQLSGAIKSSGFKGLKALHLVDLIHRAL